jgi:hypothetical protein
MVLEYVRTYVRTCVSTRVPVVPWYHGITGIVVVYVPWYTCTNWYHGTRVRTVELEPQLYVVYQWYQAVHVYEYRDVFYADNAHYRVVSPLHLSACISSRF